MGGGGTAVEAEQIFHLHSPTGGGKPSVCEKKDICCLWWQNLVFDKRVVGCFSSSSKPTVFVLIRGYCLSLFNKTFVKLAKYP